MDLGQHGAGSAHASWPRFFLCGAPQGIFRGDDDKFYGSPATFGAFKDVEGTPLSHDGGKTAFVGDIPGLVFAGYRGMFAVITPALMTGAFADRMRFGPYLFFIAVWLILVYCPFCHWIWGPGGWMAEWGIKDFAGGI